MLAHFVKNLCISFLQVRLFWLSFVMLILRIRIDFDLVWIQILVLAHLLILWQRLKNLALVLFVSKIHLRSIKIISLIGPSTQRIERTPILYWIVIWKIWCNILKRWLWNRWSRLSLAVFCYLRRLKIIHILLIFHLSNKFGSDFYIWHLIWANSRPIWIINWIWKLGWKVVHQICIFLLAELHLSIWVIFLILSEELRIHLDRILVWKMRSRASLRVVTNHLDWTKIRIPGKPLVS